ncbi:DUF2975 domain-containing protein [Latilactobacillus graminis]|uniref:Membrane protein n=2 Tax=Latilactobacillus graminis TaxID=60519 RepID=A0AA89I1Y4_9LACO|nr:DUF2975 domain-containing protein [Latilactobacillus graminis]KRM22218.1 membrane protein [Latilactobacillus graminis DSM 20719]QFP79604.1 DUF2975 domain-containing protein [Latilactobacillus graminis]
MLKKWTLRMALLGIAVVFGLLSLLVTVQIVTTKHLEYPATIWMLAIAAYGVTASIWFVLVKLVQILRLIERHQAFLPRTLLYVTAIRRAVLVASLTALFALPFFYRIAQLEDAPGLMFLGLGLVFIPFAILILMQIVEALFKSAIDLQTEIDLTV